MTNLTIYTGFSDFDELPAEALSLADQFGPTAQLQAFDLAMQAKQSVLATNSVFMLAWLRRQSDKYCLTIVQHEKNQDFVDAIELGVRELTLQL